MFKTVLKAIVNALFGFLVYRIKLWWANRQLAQAQAAHQLAVQKFDSLKVGMHIEGVVQEAGNQVVTAAAQMSTLQLQLEELQRRAENKGKEKPNA